MKSFIYVVLIPFLLLQGCKSKDYNNVKENKVKEIAVNFEASEIYKELIRRSTSFSDSLALISNDTVSTYENFNLLNNKKDTILNTSESDTVLVQSLKQQFSQYSDSELFNSYNTIIEQRASIKGIYGFDNRMDVSEDLKDNYISASKCVFAIVHKRYISKSEVFFKIGSKGTYSKYYKLCNDEAFGNQNLFADCTAFAISETRLATAGHCINDKNYMDYYLVADFTPKNAELFTKDGIPESNVFKIVKVEDQGFDERDFSILRVDKKISKNRIAKLSNKPKCTSDDYFYVIGFPCGLPMKICNTATFRQNSNPNFFQISSDTYGGNSGSPVFNEVSNEVEGILVRGNKDFYFTIDGCRKSIICPELGCRGEDVTKSIVFKKYSEKF